MRRTIICFAVFALVTIAATLTVLGIAGGGLGILSSGPHLPEHNKIYILPPGLPEGILLIIAWRCSHGAPLHEGAGHTFAFRFDRRGVSCIGSRSWNANQGDLATERYTITNLTGRIPLHPVYRDVADPLDNSPTNKLRDVEDISEVSQATASHVAYTVLFWGSADHLHRLAGETDTGFGPDPYLAYIRHVLGPAYRLP